MRTDRIMAQDTLETWVENPTAMNTYTLVGELTILKRQGWDRDKALIEKVETALKAAMPQLVFKIVEAFMKISKEIEGFAAKAVRGEEDAALELFMLRDEAESVYRQVVDWVNECCPDKHYPLHVMRKELNRIDEGFILDPNVVAELHNIGACRADKVDHDFFWWIPRQDGECHLPIHVRASFAARDAEGNLGANLMLDWHQHLRDCGKCRQIVEYAGQME